MEIGHRLQFACQKCQAAVNFSVLETASFTGELCCTQCQQTYRFDDQSLIRQLYLFEALCRQIHQSQEVLGSTSIAIDVGQHHVKVPFNLLLTRLSSVLDLKINGKKTEIIFRIEPIKDIAEAFF